MSWLSNLFSKDEQQPSEASTPPKPMVTAADYCKQGQKLLDSGKLLQALEYYQAATEIDSDNIVALRGLMNIYEMMGKTDKATVISKKLNELTAKSPVQNTTGLSPDIQLENEMRRYMNLIYTMLVVETDEFGLRLGRFSSEDNAVLLESEKSIHELEKSMGKKETDFDKIKDGVFNQYCSKPSQIQSVIDKLYKQYSTSCKEGLIKADVGYTFCPETLKELGSIEESIKALDFYLHRKTDMRTFQTSKNEAIINQMLVEYGDVCNDNVVEVNGIYGYADDVLVRLKEIEDNISILDPKKNLSTKYAQLRGNAIRDKLQLLYRELIESNLIRKKKDGKKSYVVSDEASIKERSLRSQIVAMMGEPGNKWCNNEIQGAKNRKKENDKDKRKFIGIAIGAAAVITLFVLFTEVMLYILLGIVGFILFIIFEEGSKKR